MSDVSPAPIPAAFLGDVDEWLGATRPTLDLAVETLRAVHVLAGQANLAEAHLVSYVREQLDVEDFADDPAVIADLTRDR